MYTALLITAILVIGFTVFFIRAKNQRKKQQETIENDVDTIFSAQSYRPAITSGFTYGTPSFKLKFETDEEKQHAVSNGLTEQFVQIIQERYDHLRPQGEAFDAEQAIAISSTEDEKRWAKATESSSTQ